MFKNIFVLFCFLLIELTLSYRTWQRWHIYSTSSIMSSAESHEQRWSNKVSLPNSTSTTSNVVRQIWTLSSARPVAVLVSARDPQTSTTTSSILPRLSLSPRPASSSSPPLTSPTARPSSSSSLSGLTSTNQAERDDLMGSESSDPTSSSSSFAPVSSSSIRPVGSSTLPSTVSSSPSSTRSSASSTSFGSSSSSPLTSSLIPSPGSSIGSSSVRPVSSSPRPVLSSTNRRGARDEPESSDSTLSSSIRSPTSSFPTVLCPQNERLRFCAFCDGSCRLIYPRCPLICKTVPRCFCTNGHVRNRMGKCVPIWQCQRINFSAEDN